MELCCLASPQLDTPQKAVHIADDLNVAWQFRVDKLGIASTDEESIAVECSLQQLQRLHQMPIPLSYSAPLESRTAELLFVSLTFSKRMVPQFQMCIVAVYEQRGSKASTQRNHQLY